MQSVPLILSQNRCSKSVRASNSGMYNRNFISAHQAKIMNSSLYARSGDFFMYVFKIRKCAKLRSHDWTECPYAHKGEKARRRDPLKYHYCAIICPLFHNGSCPRGDLCQFSHGIFEFWLHPARFRTRFCNSGVFCLRKVCFFAHSMQEIRPSIGYKCQCHTQMIAAPPPARRSTFPGKTNSMMHIVANYSPWTPSTARNYKVKQVESPILPNLPSPSTTKKKKVEVTWDDLLEYYKVMNHEDYAAGADQDQLDQILDAIDYSTIDWTVDWTAEVPDVNWMGV
ncbi:Zinc finger ccch domain-containing protein [Thalictrum thalictroides]|uniref:Zinc finger ccch domain-containing protein n=1 Tax=Thalictrum thalictroides TaxID=46969 RepID=A0A7J6V9D4_THATH|nr:Zinc finger ccch domain-containing protein [Thalictrum thalictroides]